MLKRIIESKQRKKIRIDQRKRRHLFERLEDRRVLNADAVLNIDFTPDSETPDLQDSGAFAEIFSLPYWQSELAANPVNSLTWAQNRTRLLQILDFNNDGTLNQEDRRGDPDASTLLGRRGAERAIVNQVRADFQPIIDSLPVTDVSVRRVANGWSKLEGSRTSDIDTYVIYVGNAFPPDPDALTFGASFQGLPNQNNEYYGHVWSGQIVKRMLRQNGPTPGQTWRPIHFRNFVTSTTSHELGHQMGLGHIFREVTLPDGTTDFRFSTTTNSLMSYGRVRWNNAATFNNFTYPLVEEAGSNFLSPQNARRELRNSLGVNGGQLTVPLINEVPLRRYYDSGELQNFGFVEPFRQIPTASLGSVGATTAIDIRNGLAAGLQAVRDQLVGIVASKLNLPSSSLPFVAPALDNLLGLSNALTNAFQLPDLSSANSLASLRSSLENDDFRIDEFLTDPQLDDLRNNNPTSSAEFLRVSKTITLVDQNGSSALDASSLSALADLAGVSFAGNMDLLANVALHLTVGVDTNGFYVAPGLILDAPISAAGELTASLGSFGNARGDATIDLRGNVSLNATSPDSRIRISQFAASTGTAEIDGLAGVDLSFSSSVAGVPLDFAGNWVWNIDNSGFSLSQEYSGFDDELLLDSLGERAIDGIEGFFDGSNGLGQLAADIPVIGDSLIPKLNDSLASLIDLSDEEFTVAERLAEAGFTIQLAPGLSARSFVDGSYVTSTNLVEVNYSNTYTPDIAPFSSSGTIDVGSEISGSLSGQLALNGDSSRTDDDSGIELSLGFGIDVASGPYLTEGSFVELKLAPTVELDGELNLGKLAKIEADASANFSFTARLTLDDGNTATDKIFVSTIDPSSITAIVQADTTTLTGRADFDLSLKASNPAANITFLGIGDAIKEALKTDANQDGAFEWTADACLAFNETCGPGLTATEFNVTSTEDYLRNIFQNVQESLFKNTFLGEIQKYNPFPDEFRQLVSSEIPFLENRSLANLTGLDELGILLSDDPTSDIGSSQEVDNGNEGGAIDVRFDILTDRDGNFSINEVVNLLSGRTANLVSLIVDKNFELVETEIPIITETLLASYFGVVNFTGALDLVGSVSIGVGLVAGLDTDGFYVEEKSDVVSLTSTLGISPKLRARLTAVEFARIEGLIAFELTGGIGFTGGLDGKVRDAVFPNVFTIGADLVFDLDGIIGFPELNLTRQFDLFDARLEIFDATYKTEAFDTGSNGFPDARSKMQSELDKIGLCAAGIGASAFIPGVGIGAAAIACGIAYSDQIEQAWDDAKEWVGDRWEDVQDSAAEAEREIREWGQERLDVLNKEAAALEKRVRNLIEQVPGGSFVLDTLGDIAQGAEDFFDTIFGNNSRTNRTQVDVLPRYSYSTPGHSAPVVIDGSLVVAWDEDRNGKLNVDMLGSGQIVINSDPLPPILETVGREQDQKRVCKIRLDPCRWENDGPARELKAEYVHSNIFVSPPDVTVNRVVIIGGDRDDFLSVSDSVNFGVEIRGEGGNDRIRGGLHDDTILGGGGNDRITGGNGGDTIEGGSGNDTIDERPGSGNRSEERNNIRGGTEDDVIYGSPGPDVITGGHGEDQIRGGGGSDEIDGGSEADRIDGESGNDTIRGGRGADVLFGSLGRDTIFGGPDRDSIDGGQDGDFLYGEGDSDRISGSGGNDLINGGAGGDLIYGGPGSDTIYGASESNENDPQDGNDVIYGESGEDVIKPGPGGPGLPNMPEGGEDRNFVDGGSDRDTITGGAGPDYIRSGEGNDTIDGMGGDDVLIGQQGSDSISGGAGNDTIHSSTDRNFQGSAVDGDEGDDFIIGSSGADKLSGGDDKDEIHGGFRDDEIDGGSGDDKITPGLGTNTATGGSGDDEFFAGPGIDTLDGQSENDKFFIENPDGDLIIAGGVITIDGGSGTNDEIYLLGGGSVDAAEIYTLGPTAAAGTLETSNSSGIQTVVFDQIDRIEDDVLVGEFVYLATDESNAITLDDGLRVNDDLIRLGSRTYVPIDFKNKRDVMVEAGRTNADLNDVITFFTTDDLTGTESFVVRGHAGDDEVDVRGTSINVDYRFEGMLGNDLFHIGDGGTSNRGSADGVNGKIDVVAGLGENRLVIRDDLGTPNIGAEITESTVLGISPASISYSTSGSFASVMPDEFGVEVFASDRGGDSLFVSSTLAEADYGIFTLSGDDSVDVARSPSTSSGDLNTIAGHVVIDGGSSAAVGDFVRFDDSVPDARYDYHLVPGSLRHLASDDFQSRPFAGVDFLSVETARLEASQGRNEIRVRPSSDTEFQVNGNSPHAEECTLGGGDFLNLDLSPFPPDDPAPVTGQQITFTEIVDGRQKAGFWSFDPPHNDVLFESIEKFNYLDKLAISDDAGWESDAEVDVRSATSLGPYSDLVTNFSRGAIEVVSAGGFGTGEGGSFLFETAIASDINRDGDVSPLDALLVINHLSRVATGSRSVLSSEHDVNGDGRVSALDALSIINHLSRVSTLRPVVGGIRTTVADLNCDGVDEIIAVTGANHEPIAQIFNGVTGRPMSAAQSIGDPENQFGVYVAAGDIDGDGKVEVITSMERGDTSVRIWEFDNNRLHLSTTIDTGISLDSQSGVRVASGDLNGDLVDEIVVSTGTGREPAVMLFSGSGEMLQDLVVSSDLGRGGLTAAVGDVNHDGLDDLLIAAGRRGASSVYLGFGSDQTSLVTIQPTPQHLYSGDNDRAPLSLVMKDSDGDGDMELFSAQQSDGRSSEIKHWDWTGSVDQMFAELGTVSAEGDFSGEALG